jgi:hypothetical protein
MHRAKKGRRCDESVIDENDSERDAEQGIENMDHEGYGKLYPTAFYCMNRSISLETETKSRPFERGDYPKSRNLDDRNVVLDRELLWNHE